MEALTTQDSDKCLTESLVEHCIDDWVDCAGDVAEPEEQGSQPWWDLTSGSAEANDKVDGKEWSPADEEAAENDGQHPGCFVFICKVLSGSLQIVYTYKA